MSDKAIATSSIVLLLLNLEQSERNSLLTPHVSIMNVLIAENTSFSPHLVQIYEAYNYPHTSRTETTLLHETKVTKT